MRMLIALLATAMLASAAHAAVLYDVSISGQTPQDQGMYYLAVDPVNLLDVNAAVTYAAGYTQLTTASDMAEYAGFYNYDSLLGQSQKTAVSLDRAGDGYTLRFTARLDAESHASGDRAGFSVIATSSDGWGIELGFWADSVWAQADGGSLFTQAESAAFDTAANVVEYDLAVLGDGYTLYAAGQAVLTGDLRRYRDAIAAADPTAAADPFNPRHVYFLDDFVFLGDDTSSASAAVTLGDIAVLPTATPEPTSLVVLALGAVVLLAHRRRRHV